MCGLTGEDGAAFLLKIGLVAGGEEDCFGRTVGGGAGEHRATEVDGFGDAEGIAVGRGRAKHEVGAFEERPDFFLAGHEVKVLRDAERVDFSTDAMIVIVVADFGEGEEKPDGGIRVFEFDDEPDAHVKAVEIDALVEHDAESIGDEQRAAATEKVVHVRRV